MKVNLTGRTISSANEISTPSKAKARNFFRAFWNREFQVSNSVFGGRLKLSPTRPNVNHCLAQPFRINKSIKKTLAFGEVRITAQSAKASVTSPI